MQRDLDCGLGGIVCIHALAHGRARSGDVLGRGARDRGREIENGRHHAFDGLAGHGRGRSGFAPADHAVVRLDPYNHVVRMPDFDTRHEDRLLHGDAHRNRLNAFDLHQITLGRVGKGAHCRQVYAVCASLTASAPCPP